jgi:predicted PurR-regulated permease PerM
MRFIKGVFRWLTTVILHLSLFALIGAICFNVFFGSSSSLKNSIAESGVYESFVPSIISANIEQQTNESNSIPLEDPEIQRIINEVFNPKLLQASADTVIDGVYTWLDGNSEILKFEINFTQQRTELIDRLSTYSALRLKGLPPCTAIELQTANVFRLQCQPPGFYETLVKNQVKDDLNNSDFLKDSVLTEKNLPIVKEGVAIDQKFHFAPIIFSVLKNGIWLFGFSFLLATAVYISIRKPKRKGINAYSKDLLANGIMLLVFTVFYSIVVPKLLSSYSLQASTGSSALNESLNYFTNRLDILVINIAIQITALGAIIFAIERMSRTAGIYGVLAKKSGLTTSIEHFPKTGKKEKTNKPPVQTSETAKKPKYTKQKSSKFKKIGL